MNFICEPCRKAGEESETTIKHVLHRQCPGKGQCDCQHRVPNE